MRRHVGAQDADPSEQGKTWVRPVKRASLPARTTTSRKNRRQNGSTTTTTKTAISPHRSAIAPAKTMNRCRGSANEKSSLSVSRMALRSSRRLPAWGPVPTRNRQKSRFRRASQAAAMQHYSWTNNRQTVISAGPAGPLQGTGSSFKTWSTF